MESESKKWRHRFEAVLLFSVKTIIRLFPFRLAPHLGSLLGFVLGPVLKLQWRLTLLNLERAFGDRFTPQERQKLARDCYRFFGRLMVEVFSMDRLAKRDWRNYVVLENPEVMDRALAAGKGVVLVSGHFGNWEWMGGALSSSGRVLTMYVGEQANPVVDQELNRQRSSMGTLAIKPGAAMRQMIKALKGNGIVAMLSDQHYSRKIHFIRFFGRVVSTVPGPAALVLRTQSKLLVGLSVREGWMRYRVRLVEVEANPTGQEELDILTLSQRVSSVLEEAVRAHPEQYFWMHNRWKDDPKTFSYSPVNRAFLDQTGGG